MSLSKQSQIGVHEAQPSVDAPSKTHSEDTAEKESDAISQDTRPSEQVDIEEPIVRSRVSSYANGFALMTSLFIAALDETLIATAVPTISSSLHSASGYSWIAGSYLLSTAALGPVVVKVSDIWGRKPIILFSVGVFFLSSLICALAVNMPMLIFGRTLQGIGGGGLLGLVAVILSDLYSERERAVYFTFMAMTWSVAAAIGPLFGGAFSQTISWRWCFWINLPVSGLAFVLLLKFLKVHNPRTSLKDGLGALDWAGTASLVGCTILLLVGLNFGGQAHPWNSATVISLLVVGGLMIGVFAFSEKKLAEYPVIPLRVFKSRSNLASLVIAFIHSFVSIGACYYLPLFFQSVRQASPLRSGILTLSFTVTDALIAVVAGVVLNKAGSFIELLYIGTALLTLGAGLLIMMDVNSSIGVLVGLQIAVGTGVGVLFQPALAAIQADTSQEDMSNATATFGLARTLASAMSVVIGGVVFQNGMSEHRTQLRAAGASMEVLREFSGEQALANVKLVGDIANPALQMAVKSAYASSMRDVWIMYTSISAVALLASVFVKRKILRHDHTETKTGLKKKS